MTPLDRCFTALLHDAWYGLAIISVAVLAEITISCDAQKAGASEPGKTAHVHEVGVVKTVRRTMERQLVVSSELVPFQQIDVYAKESGFVRELDVDYGTHVKEGQVMAILEIPELRMQLEEDEASIRDATGQVARARKEVDRVDAQHKVAHLEFSRLDQVAKQRPGLVAQQEVDDRQGTDLAAEAQVEGAQSNLESAESLLARAQARLRHDQVLYDYSKITAPFTGVVTKRYANLGTLMQSGMNSSTQAMPLVQLSEDGLFRLVIPVSESWVPFIHIGDPVDVRVPTLNRNFPGKVARFSVDVQEDTRTMHTEVDVPNPNHVLVPGVYAEATLRLDRKANALAVPQEAVNIDGDERTVWVIDPSNKVEERKVTTGIETPHDVEITSGLKEGELVAVGDRSALTAGETVQTKVVEIARNQNE